MTVAALCAPISRLGDLDERETGEGGAATFNMRRSWFLLGARHAPIDEGRMTRIARSGWIIRKNSALGSVSVCPLEFVLQWRRRNGTRAEVSHREETWKMGCRHVPVRCFQEMSFWWTS
jgi:hypothetical protein